VVVLIEFELEYEDHKLFKDAKGFKKYMNGKDGTKLIKKWAEVKGMRSKWSFLEEN